MVQYGVLQWGPKIKTTDQFRLEVRIEGPEVGAARFDAADLGAILTRLQQAVSRVGELLHGESSSRGQGRKRQEIEQLCRLQLVEWRPGSAVPILELGRPSAQLALFRHIGEESVQALVNGIALLDAPSTKHQLPQGWDEGVLESVRALTDRIGKSYETLTLSVPTLPQPLTAVVDRAKRAAVIQWLEAPPRQEERVVVGRLEDPLGHNRRIGRLYQSDNSVWECYFDQTHDRLLAENWLGLVALEGQAVIEGGRRTLIVTGPIRKVGASPGADEYGSFWQPVAFEELARRQGVEPISDFNSWLSSLPTISEEEADGFYDQLAASREERRELERQGRRG